MGIVIKKLLILAKLYFYLTRSFVRISGENGVTSLVNIQQLHSKYVTAENTEVAEKGIK